MQQGLVLVGIRFMRFMGPYTGWGLPWQSPNLLVPGIAAVGTNRYRLRTP